MIESDQSLMALIGVQALRRAATMTRHRHRRVLQTVQRRLARQRRTILLARLQTAQNRTKNRIAAQLIVVYNAHRIDLKGESMRRKNARPDLTTAAAAEDNPG